MGFGSGLVSALGRFRLWVGFGPGSVSALGWFLPWVGFCLWVVSGINLVFIRDHSVTNYGIILASIL